MLATATWPNETGCNVDDSGGILRSATIHQHHQEDGAGKDRGSVSICHSLQTGAVSLRFLSEQHDQ